MKVFLVRHAEGENSNLTWQAPSTGLSEKGVKQSEALAKRISQFNAIDTIITSDWERAKQTATIVAKAINIPIGIDGRLQERHQSSKIYGLPRTDPLAEKYTNDLIKNRSDWNYKWDLDEESFTELTERSIAFEKDLIKNSSQKSVMLFSHKAFLSALVCISVLGDKFDNNFFKNLFRSITMENTGISLLIYREEQKTWKLWYLNDYSHLSSVK